MEEAEGNEEPHGYFPLLVASIVSSREENIEKCVMKSPLERLHSINFPTVHNAYSKNHKSLYSSLMLA